VVGREDSGAEMPLFLFNTRDSIYIFFFWWAGDSAPSNRTPTYQGTVFCFFKYKDTRYGCHLSV